MRYSGGEIAVLIGLALAADLLKRGTLGCPATKSMYCQYLRTPEPQCNTAVRCPGTCQGLGKLHFVLVGSLMTDGRL